MDKIVVLKQVIKKYGLFDLQFFLFFVSNELYKHGVFGNDVWIADNVTIMSGVRIGDGAVIACNSHAVKDVEPYSIDGGNPAKFIKYRFTQEQIECLLKIQWWKWSPEKINEHVHLLNNDKINEFIDKHNDSCVI